ncbi:hypothetical protein ACFY19_09615 [Streptosporangium saharense]|uniref:hypothetical protein n=1 Tax=Streptosporangium saharense TaxID=1706840 RepID=UPI00368A5BC8
MVVQHAVRDPRLAGDVADGESGGAALGDEPGGGGDEVVAQLRPSVPSRRAAAFLGDITPHPSEAS